MVGSGAELGHAPEKAYIEKSHSSKPKTMNKKKAGEDKSGEARAEETPGYPEHPPEEDIYRQEEEVPFREGRDRKGARNPGEVPEQDLDEGLDVPGAELDDANESIGEEDEENNYYSLGGDNHDEPG